MGYWYGNGMDARAMIERDLFGRRFIAGISSLLIQLEEFANLF